MNSFPTKQTLLAHRISYGETDTMGVLYYAEYLHLFERSRSEFIRNQGMSYNDVEARGIFLPVREAKCRYKSPARYDDLVWIRVGISNWGRASIDFVYEILNEDKSIILAEGMTQHAVVGTNGRPCAVPDWLKDLWNTQ